MGPVHVLALDGTSRLNALSSPPRGMAPAQLARMFGRDEIATGRFGLKDLQSGEQENVEEGAILARVGAQDGR